MSRVNNLTEIYKAGHSLHQNQNKITNIQLTKTQARNSATTNKLQNTSFSPPPSPSRLFLSSLGTIFTASLYLPADRGSRTGAVSPHAAFPRQAGNHSSDRRVRVYGEDEPAAVGHGGKRTQG